MSCYWTNSKGERIDVDTITDVGYLQNILKFIIRRAEAFNAKQDRLNTKCKFNLNGNMADQFNTSFDEETFYDTDPEFYKY